MDVSSTLNRTFFGTGRSNRIKDRLLEVSGNIQLYNMLFIELVANNSKESTIL